jgi:hypothetical protein
MTWRAFCARANVQGAALLAQMFAMRYHAGFYRRHRTRALAALRVLEPMCVYGAWLSSQPRPYTMPTRTVYLDRVLLGVFVSLGWPAGIYTRPPWCTT